MSNAVDSSAIHSWRPGEKSDHELVYSTWKQTYRRSFFGGEVDKTIYGSGMDWLIGRLLERCALSCAAFDERPSFVLGWALTSTNCVHYVNVHPRFRGLGIARDLLKPYLDKPTIYTFRVRSLRVPASWIFDPFHAYRIACA